MAIGIGIGVGYGNGQGSPSGAPADPLLTEDSDEILTEGGIALIWE